MLGIRKTRRPRRIVEQEMVKFTEIKKMPKKHVENGISLRVIG